ncbi:uncharacterized protein MONBRDRAFT_29101 [Monosiga brevicollis MX1]|uniref:RRM domain-containing protein n=1 Tax=Monosiga brevicollis TaxID=81824 RepID=A9VA46_MONBE|nr:uncharacterized protein MONBRDRAFT_29101 [Monosiga brevicollis MX1]EDQ85665.1 predicted protein [Monosiga brevicollis MX1]|eukprot:XP_001749614.1 hypothetical protein [Monosiga brevicollis MX1]
MDVRTQRSQGFGFVKFANPEDALRARIELKDALICGRPFVMEQARRSRGWSPSPGTYKGRRENDFTRQPRRFPDDLRDRDRPRFDDRDRARFDDRDRPRFDDRDRPRFDDRDRPRFDDRDRPRFDDRDRPRFDDRDRPRFDDRDRPRFDDRDRPWYPEHRQPTTTDPYAGQPPPRLMERPSPARRDFPTPAYDADRRADGPSRAYDQRIAPPPPEARQAFDRYGSSTYASDSSRSREPLSSSTAYVPPQADYASGQVRPSHSNYTRDAPPPREMHTSTYSHDQPHYMHDAYRREPMAPPSRTGELRDPLPRERDAQYRRAPSPRQEAYERPVPRGYEREHTRAAPATGLDYVGVAPPPTRDYVRAAPPPQRDHARY